jgi:hypothetical protein
MQSTTTISNKLDAAVAKQILNYKEGEIKIIMGAVDTNSIVDALAVNLNINKVTLVADKSPDCYLEIKKIISSLANISSLKEMILDLSAVDKQLLYCLSHQSAFTTDFQNIGSGYSFSVIKPTLNDISICNLKTIETLKVIGNLRNVDLIPILDLSLLKSLDFSNCSITYDTFLPFVTKIPEKLSQLNILNVNNNPIDLKSIDEKGDSINNLFTCMSETLKQSAGKLIISMDGCFTLGGYYANHMYKQLPSWKPIEAMLEEAKKRQSVEHLQVMYKGLQELSEEVAALELLSEAKLQYNAGFQRTLKSKQEELQQLCEDIEKSLTILDSIGFDGHYIHAQIKELNEEFDEAYKLLNAIPNSHKDYAEAQHKMAMLVAKIEQPGNILDLNDIIEPKHDINLQKLILHVQLATNVAQLQAPSDADYVEGVLKIANNAAGEYVTGQFGAGALLKNPVSKFGCNLNTIATLLQRLKEANTMVGKLSENLEQLEQAVEKLRDKQYALSNQVVYLEQANRQAQPLIVHQFKLELEPAPQQPKLARRKSESDLKNSAKFAM